MKGWTVLLMLVFFSTLAAEGVEEEDTTLAYGCSCDRRPTLYEKNRERLREFYDEPHRYGYRYNYRYDKYLYPFYCGDAVYKFPRPKVYVTTLCYPPYTHLPVGYR